jgi:glycosyltransferase involved in cell wall biosynthesis
MCANDGSDPMRIMHILRSPVGGLFRHVRDLTEAQIAAGATLGIIVSDEAGGGSAEALEKMRPMLKLGLHKLPIHRLPHPSDLKSVAAVRRLMLEKQVDIAHGHGAKGGLLARLSRVPSVYTPHGGSLHYRWKNPVGAAFLAAEKAMVGKTGGFIFVCDFERRAFDTMIGLRNRPNIVVLNGLRDQDFEVVPSNPDATDLLFVGEMRDIKGVDVLLQAIKACPQKLTATLVGEGPDLAKFKSMRDSLGLSDRVTFPGRLPFHEALTLGRIVVLPSRNEAFPYVVLESVAAGRIIVASDVGGVKEVLNQNLLVPPGNVGALSDKLDYVLTHPDLHVATLRDIRLNALNNLTIARMAEASLTFYQTVRAAE